ncbi:uncharacterized protein LOC62_07G009060 [Vanrija pseudolonga]|uniref:Uncharacterized protein n=1 Tax=Vanrija pseudolonga TaxID=143232 RepID=A0AAF1BLW6_9TREE|nr:hypothetical protein LOC62_07G009060 [Vanrija pseudolonga]
MARTARQHQHQAARSLSVGRQHPVPTPASPLFAPSRPSRLPLRPLPLLPVALADVSYAAWRAYNHPQATPPYLPALAVLRAAVLLLVVLPSARWRSRGSWVIAAAAASIITCTYEVCAARLMRIPVDEGTYYYLGITCLISAFEYVFFLLLVRLVPAPTAQQPPFSMRGPPAPSDGRSPSLPPLSPSLTPMGVGRRRASAHMSIFDRALFATPSSRIDDLPSSSDSREATPDAAGDRTFGTMYTVPSDDDGWRGDFLGEYDELERAVRGTSREPRFHVPAPSAADASFATTTDGFPSPIPYPTSSRVRAPPVDELGRSYASTDYGGRPIYSLGAGANESFDVEMGLASDEYYSDDDSASTVSESSIIDMPRPTGPTAIVVRDGTSISAGLNLAAEVAGAAEGAVGELVRRSTSARFLGHSWGSNAAVEESGGESGWGYGTFGRRAGG